MTTIVNKDLFCLFQYVSKTPRTRAELEPVCRRATPDATIRQHWAYGDPKSVTCPRIILGPRFNWITPKYPLKARIESPTGFTKDGEEEYVVACCYQQTKPTRRQGRTYQTA